MAISIIGPHSGRPLATIDADSLVGADLRNLDLRSAHLEDTRLQNCDFRGSQLMGCQFMRSDLTGSNFSGCHLNQVHFHQAILAGTLLDGITVDWFSFVLVEELMMREATNDTHRELATYGRTHKACWETLASLASHPATPWALNIFARYIRDDDNCPPFLRAAIIKECAKATVVS
jgi:hypothetical protein